MAAFSCPGQAGPCSSCCRPPARLTWRPPPPRPRPWPRSRFESKLARGLVTVLPVVFMMVLPISMLCGECGRPAINEACVRVAGPHQHTRSPPCSRARAATTHSKALPAPGRARAGIITNLTSILCGLQTDNEFVRAYCDDSGFWMTVF